MPRYPHFLSATCADTQPARLVAIECESVYRNVGCGGKVQTEHLTGWAAAGWRESGGKSKVNWGDTGSDVESLWRAVTWTLRRGGRTWIVSRCAARDWGLFGLWDRIDTGEIYFVGQNRRAGKGVVKSDVVPQVSRMAGADVGRRDGHTAHCLPEVSLGGGDGTRRGGAAEGDGSGVHGFAVIEDPPTVIQCRARGLTGTLCLVDLRNYGIDCEPAGVTALERARWIREVMRRMVNTLTTRVWGSLCVTAGSQSLFTFRRAFLHQSIYCHTNAEALELEGKAYVGGRVGCGRIGPITGPVYHVDFRSLYAALCVFESVPCMLLGSDEGPPPEGMGQDGGRRTVICDVQVRAEEPYYPCRSAKETTYPVGTWRTVLAGPEFCHAMQSGCILRVHRHAIYSSSRVLGQYAAELYQCLEQVRKAGDTAIVQWIKRLLNSLVGKFGQRGNTWRPYPLADPPERWYSWHVADEEGRLLRARSLGPQVEIERVEQWSNNACPAIAAHICSAGRIKLLEAIRCAGWLNVYYYDTDSLIVSAAGYDRLVRAGRMHANVLGELRLLGEYKSAHIFGPKHYQLDGVVTCAGLPRGESRRGPDPTTYYLYDWLRRVTAEGKVPGVTRRLRKFETRAVYRGGRVGADGWVYPHVVGG